MSKTDQEKHCTRCMYLRMVDTGAICEVDNKSILIAPEYLAQCKEAGWRWIRVRESISHSRTTGAWAEFLEKYR